MKVLLLDDHPLVLTAVRNVIHALDPETVVRTVDNPAQAFALLATETDVDLVLLDLGLGPAIDGFAVLVWLREHHPGLPVVVLSAIDRLSDMVRAIDMGAMGFVPKSSPTAGLSDALALVLAGGVFIPAALLGLIALGGNLADAAAAADAASGRQAARAQASQWAAQGLGDMPQALLKPMGDGFVDSATDHPPLAAPPVGLPTVSPLPATGPLAATRAGLAGLGLTPRQSEVLLLLLRGLPNKLIARELALSVDTVKDHVAAVLRALGVATRTQAVLRVSGLSQQAMAPARAAPA